MTITRTETSRSEFEFTARIDGRVVAICRTFEAAERAFKVADRKRVRFVVA